MTRRFAFVCLLLTGCGVSARDATTPAKTIAPVDDAEVELTLVQEEGTFKLYRGGQASRPTHCQRRKLASAGKKRTSIHGDSPISLAENQLTIVLITLKRTLTFSVSSRVPWRMQHSQST